MCTFLFYFLREGKCDVLWVPKNFILTFISFVENRSLWIDLIKASSAKFPAWSNCFKQWMKVFQYPSPFFCSNSTKPPFFFTSKCSLFSLFLKKFQVWQWDCGYFLFSPKSCQFLLYQIEKQPSEDGKELIQNFVGGT